MPGIVKVKIIEGRNLPVMDKSADTTDAYVELKLGSISYKSDVCRKSLNPQWNTEWYKFEMADADLQDEPLQLRVMDYDTYSANDLIGKVYFNLNPLLVNSTSEIRNNAKSSLSVSPGSGCISGWFPIYDTLSGLRGEINVIIKLELFSDFNKFRQSSCGVHIFSCSMIPHGYYTENIYGLVEELVIEDDPEYQWIEKIRSPRASNEARQAIFYKMSGVVQRKIGMKVVEMGGNAIIGYRQCFDLEGETGGVVVRGIGTAVKLNRVKKFENVVVRNSFGPNFKVPEIMLTSSFESQSDVCSMLSLNDSLHSDNYLSEFAADDRWSLCSFASHASSNSRYTSVETMLDQTNREPIAKSSSKLLNVARYFTSSKLRSKFLQKKKHKSILLRKFSVIEEYKQKGNGGSSFSADLDGLAREKSEEIDTLERVPTVVERTSRTHIDPSLSTKSGYFNMSSNSNKALTDGQMGQRSDDFPIMSRSNENTSTSTNADIEKIAREDRTMQNIEDEAVDDILSADEGSSASVTRQSTPPLSEMTPYRMSPTTVPKVVVSDRNGSSKTLNFEKNFLKTLRRKQVTDYFTLSNSPEIRRLGMLKESKLLKSCPVLSTNVFEERDEIDSLSSMNSVASSPEKLKNDLPIIVEKFDHFNLVVDDDSINNENNFNVGIATEHDNNNVTSGALTSGRLFMHANNLDRNISEGDKGDEAGKKEAIAASELAIKNRSLSDTGMLIKNAEPNKAEAGQEKENTGSVKNTDGKGYNLIRREDMELMEYPFLTLSSYPDDFIVHLGGTVSARSVKLLDRISNSEEPETRDAWWTELRIEIKSHMRALACNAVLNYTENTSICDEVCLLSATGTAALVKVYDSSVSKFVDDSTRSSTSKISDTGLENEIKTDKNVEEMSNVNCSVFHIPYRKSSLPFPVNIKSCEICRKGFVADVTFVTIEPLERMPVIGQGAFIHAFVCRLKRDCRSELNAREISEGLPFLEYELNRQLMNKLRIKGMNALFGLNVHVSIGDKIITAYATGTALLLSVLPTPPELRLGAYSRAFTQNPNSIKRFSEISKLVEDTIKQNKIYYQLIEHQNLSHDISKMNVQNTSCDIAIQDQYPVMDYFAGSKQTCVIEVDDEDDLETITQLIDSNPPQGFFVSATEKVLFNSLPLVPKKNIQLFVQVYRCRIPNNTPANFFNKYFHRIVQTLYMKIHHRIPCSLNKISFKINIPESDELQIRIVGMALALKESEKALESISTSCSSVSELADDTVLGADTEKEIDQDLISTLTPMKHISKKREKRVVVFDNEIHVTSLSYIPGVCINFYLGNLNFIFIRESSMVKEQSGGVSNFVNSFISDVMVVVKSHAAGIGGNAVVNFFLNECLLTTHSHKNQGQCLIHVGGDIVRYTYRAT